MTQAQAEQFVIHALTLAMDRDGSSGGVVRLAIITKEGVERKLITEPHLPHAWRD